MFRLTSYALALSASIVFVPIASPAALLVTQVRAYGTVTRILPNGFGIVLDRERTDHTITWEKDPITVLRSDNTRIVAQNPRHEPAVRVGARVEITGGTPNGAYISADLVRILAAAEPAPRVIETPAGFTFDDMRVQLVEKDGARGVTQVKSGTYFYPFAYITIPHAHGETYFATFSLQFGNQAPVDAYHDSQKVPVIVDEKAGLSFSNRMRARLAENVPSQNVSVIGRITSNGVTRTRTTSFTLVR